MPGPFLGPVDALRGGIDPDDGREIDHTPKMVGAIVLGSIAFLWAFHNWGGFQVVIGAGGR